ncbi:hypothetical protein [Paramicrobacterium humi]|nr:hypothetical protein [Microbacterium humi]
METRETEPAEHGGNEESAEHSKPMDMDMDMDMDMSMDMPMPGGIPLASGGSDRDGLEMDVLHVPLGPVLPHWPAGLVVHCALQGDVIVSAEPEVLPAGLQPNNGGPIGNNDRSAEDERRSTVIRLSDAAVQVLALAGWSHAAGRARRIRDEVSAGTALVDVAADLDGLARSVSRSWLLRWALKGITVGGAFANAGEGIGQDEPETVRDRLIGWLDEARRIARDNREAYESPDNPELQRSLLDAIPRLLSGTDVATARLIVAGLAIQTAQIAQDREPRT